MAKEVIQSIENGRILCLGLLLKDSRKINPYCEIFISGTPAGDSWLNEKHSKCGDCYKKAGNSACCTYLVASDVRSSFELSLLSKIKIMLQISTQLYKMQIDLFFTIEVLLKKRLSRYMCLLLCSVLP